MKAVIMAGGFGTRLRPLTCTIPKPLVPMLNNPIMEHIVRLLRRYNFKDIIMLLHYQGEIIKDYFEDGKDMGVKISYVEEEEDLGTAGSVKNAQKFLTEPFLVISGDIITDFDLSKIVDFHNGKKSPLTITLTRVKNPLEFGIVLTKKNGRIDRFLEKPSWGEVFSDTINTGIYVIQPEVLEYIPKSKEFDFSKNLFPLLMEKGFQLFGYIASGYWRDIGNIPEYRLAHYEALRKDIKIDLPGVKLGEVGSAESRHSAKSRHSGSGSARGEKNIWSGKETIIDPAAILKGTVVIGDNCELKGNVEISDAVIGNNCTVEDGAIVNKCIIWNNTLIGKGAHLKENVVGKNCKIGDKVFMEEGAIIGDDCRIGDASLIRQAVKIWPHKVVEKEAIVSSSLVWGEKWSKSLFGAYGVTGLSNTEVTPEFSAKLGAAYGATMEKGSSVITSRDSHRSSRMIKRSFIAGLLSSGINVDDIRDMPLPVVRYTLRTSREYCGGIHVRMSPYDPLLMDIKFLDSSGMDISSGKEKSIERLFFREDFRRANIEETGSLEVPSRIVEYYREGFLSLLDTESIKKRKFKIVMDYGFSSAANIFPSIVGELGCEVIALNAYTNDKKGAKTLEEFNNSIKQLSNIVVTLKADIGFLLDTGAEKIFLVDEDGSILPGDLSLALISLLVLKSHSNPRIAVPVTASYVIEKMAGEYNALVLRTKTNPCSMMAVGSLKEVDFIGEIKGGYIFPLFQSAFDAMFSIGKILELIARTGIPLNQLIPLIPKICMVREHVFCPWETKGKIMRLLIDDTKDKNRELIEGIKVYEEEKNSTPWVIIIPDEDRALFHVNAEAQTIEEAQELARKYVSKIKEWQGE
ncbi:hypothetical protein AUJ66_00530 [Candidatus Desantisbacteria bacterium CG1_02_38_46]|nr:MAG: hypothetical protein AUJ66_00530 [Candidatus Desantisbacteria bacterium CG1_02_38_46]